MAFCLSKLSRDRPHGVHPDLVRVVERAIQITTQHFRLQEGLRARERRRRPLQRPYRRVPHLGRPAFRRLDRDHLDNLSDPGAFAAAGAEEQQGGGGEPPPLAGASVVVCLMG
jgi:peptidoglycan L-alanyl-D-glutamate endopeptidase CwlK